MLDYENSAEQMTHQQNNMLAYQPQPHQQQLTQNSDGYFSYGEPPVGNHRQPFAINSAPLAALHSMADMKSSQPSSMPPDAAVASYNPAAYYSMKHCLNAAAATPHGITDILSRPDLQAQLQARLGQGVYYNNSSCSQSQSNSNSIGLSHNGKDGVPATSRSVYHWTNNGQMLSSGQTPYWPNKHGKFPSLLVLITNYIYLRDL